MIIGVAGQPELAHGVLSWQGEPPVAIDDIGRIGIADHRVAVQAVLVAFDADLAYDALQEAAHRLHLVPRLAIAHVLVHVVLVERQTKKAWAECTVTPMRRRCREVLDATVLVDHASGVSSSPSSSGSSGTGGVGSGVGSGCGGVGSGVSRMLPSWTNWW
jgi:uncharacterized membrane protein YgcG